MRASFVPAGTPPLVASLLVLCVGFLDAGRASAWDDHALITWAALDGVPGFDLGTVDACSADDLLLKTLLQQGDPIALRPEPLVAALEAGDRDARALQPAVPPLPEELRFHLPPDFLRHLLAVFDAAIGRLVEGITGAGVRDELGMEERPEPPPTTPQEKLDGATVRADVALAWQSLLGALRLNPWIKLAPFVQHLPGAPDDGRAALDAAAVTLVPRHFAEAPPEYREIRLGGPKASVTAAEVLASASNEPDYGLDLGLFADNDTAHGARYGFGAQPFGNPKLAFGTQAPFHMGFYHESSLLYSLAPAFRRTFPELRVAQYLALARWALASEKPCGRYWGLRFAGWALHHVQDLTQPYHSRLFPGKSTAGLIWTTLLDAVGVHGPKQRAVTLLSNRHLVLENIARLRLIEEMRRPRGTSELLRRLADPTADAALGVFDLHDLRGVISAEAHAEAGAMDESLRECLPTHYVDDAGYDFGADPSPQELYPLVKQSPAPACAELISAIDARLLRAAIHTRRLLRALP